jgi:hypothetical protein
MDSRSQVIAPLDWAYEQVCPSSRPYSLFGLWLNDALALQHSPLRRPWTESQAAKRSYPARQWRHTRVVRMTFILARMKESRISLQK